MGIRPFVYRALNTSNKIVDGELSAASEEEVIKALQGKNLTPLSVKGQSTLFQFGSTKISATDLIDFSNGLATLIEAHTPIDRSLSLLEGITEKPAMRQLILSLQRDVKEGQSLADAMRSHPQTFSPLYISMVEAGEAGGILERLLSRLVSFLERTEETRRELISALVYPAILLTVGILSVVLLLVFVVPQFATLFDGAGTTIPPSAAFLLDLGDFLQRWGWTLLIPPLAIVVAWRWVEQDPDLHLQRDQLLLQLPLLGSLLLESESSRFCRTLSALLGAGIPLLKALEITHGVLGNRQLGEDLTNSIEQVRAGRGLGASLSHAGNFPTLISQLITVGEETGRTAQVLETLSGHLERNVKAATTRLVSLLEPATILTMGVFVGGIVITMLNAIFSINDVQF